MAIATTPNAGAVVHSAVRVSPIASTARVAGEACVPSSARAGARPSRAGNRGRVVIAARGDVDTRVDAGWVSRETGGALPALVAGVARLTLADAHWGSHRDGHAVSVATHVDVGAVVVAGRPNKAHGAAITTGSSEVGEAVAHAIPRRARGSGRMPVAAHTHVEAGVQLAPGPSTVSGGAQ